MPAATVVAVGAARLGGAWLTQFHSNRPVMSEQLRVTLKDIAAVVGVSAVTVSLALRNHPKIPARRRETIQEAAQRMGYQPDAMAAALVHKRWQLNARPISAALAWVNHWREPQQLRGYREFELYWQGAQQAAEKLGFRLDEFIVDATLPFRRLETILQSRNIQGVLVPPHGRQALTEINGTSLSWERYAVVKFGYSVPKLPSHVVTANHVHNTMLACAEIRARGYQRIGYHCYGTPLTRGRAGFLMSQEELPPEERLPVLSLSLNSPAALPQLDAWLQAHTPDAILTEVAELPKFLAQLGVRVPQDVALASLSVLDGNVAAGIYQNSADIGRVATETLISRIFNHHTGFPALPCETLVAGRWQDGVTLPDRRLNDKPAMDSTIAG
jgi:LacI family transcriptional regulator